MRHCPECDSPVRREKLAVKFAGDDDEIQAWHWTCECGWFEEIGDGPDDE